MSSAPAFPAPQRAAASALLLPLLFLFLLLPCAVRAQGPKPVSDYVPKLTAYPEADRSSWIEYSTAAGVKHTLETSLDQQTWTAVEAGSVYGTGAPVKVRVKEPTVLLPGEPVPLPPHPVYRYFVMAVGNGQAHVTGFPRQGQQAFFRLISWPFAQSAFPGIGVYGAVIEPKAGYPAVANVPYQVLFDAWSVAPDVTALPITASLTAQQQTMMDALTNAMPWIEHDLAVNPPLVDYGPPQPFQAVTAEQRSYFRVRVQFQDSDSDGVQDHIELEDGSNPFLADTDGDGLSDSAEKTAGSDSSSYDLPEITLESRRRSVMVEDVRDAYAPTLMVSFNGAPSAQETATLPANFRYAPGGTLGGQLNPLNVADYYTATLPNNTTRTPWSEWEESDGSERTVFNIYRHKDAAGTLLTQTVEIREFQMRLKASRPLPHGWNAVVQTAARSRLNVGEWSALSSGLYPAGIGGNKFLKLVIPPNGTASPEYHFYVLPFENSENKQAELTWFRPRIADGTPGNTYGTAGTLHPLTQVFAAPTFAGDTDKDGVPLPVETALSMDNTKWNSRGSDIPDCNRPVRGLAGRNLSAEVQERTFDWDRIPYSTGNKEKGKAIAHWKANAEALYSSSQLDTDPVEISSHLVTLMPFDGTGTNPEEGMALSAGGELTSIGGSSNKCHHARLSHKRIRLVLRPAPKKETKLTYLVITERKQGSAAEVVTAEPVTFTFTANNPNSDYYELKPSFTSAASVYTSTAPAGLVEKVTATLAPVEWVYAEGEKKNTPRYTLPMWIPQKGQLIPNSEQLAYAGVSDVAAFKLRIRTKKLPEDYRSFELKLSSGATLEPLPEVPGGAPQSFEMEQQGSSWVSKKPGVLIPDYAAETDIAPPQREEHYVLKVPNAYQLDWRNMPGLEIRPEFVQQPRALVASIAIKRPGAAGRGFRGLDSLRATNLAPAPLIIPVGTVPVIIPRGGVFDDFVSLGQAMAVNEAVTKAKLLSGFMSGKDVFYFYGHGVTTDGALVSPTISGQTVGDISGIGATDGILSAAEIGTALPAPPDCKVVFLACCSSLLTHTDAKRSDSMKDDFREGFSGGADTLARSFGSDTAVFGFGNMILADEGNDWMREFLQYAKKFPVARADSVYNSWVEIVKADDKPGALNPKRLLKFFPVGNGGAVDLNNEAP